MKTTIHHLRLAIALGTLLAGASPLLGQTPIGQWDFNNSNLVATVGMDLTYANDGGLTQQGTQFGTTTSFGIPNINGSNAIVMRFPAATNGGGYMMTAPPNPNGGGTEVNVWTLIMDLLYPGASDKQIRPLIDTDGSTFVAGPDFVIDSSDGIGSPPSGPYDGMIASNTWYRVGIVVTNTEIDYFLNGALVGTVPNVGCSRFVDCRFALTPSLPTAILGTTFTNAAEGYVNSIQLWDVNLNAGQMLALGGPSAAGIPTNIPPVPSFIQLRVPAINDVNVLPQPDIHVVLNQGNTTVTSSSIQLSFDGVALSPTVAANPPTFDITTSVTNFLDPASVHTLSLVWQDNVAGTTTNTWSFAVLNYQSITLPSPFYLENFDEVTEGLVPAGWVATNATFIEHTNSDFCDVKSMYYVNWLVINTNKFCGTCNIECGTLYNEPPIVVNGTLLDTLGHQNVLFFESDNRCGSCYGQIGMLFTSDIDCTGKTNVFVSFHSLYLQNQNNIAALEYSIDGGTNWLPVLYYLPISDGTDFSNTDVIRTNGVIDVNATFNLPNHDGVAGGTNWAYFIAAPVSTNLIPYIQGVPDDEASFVVTAGNVRHDYWQGKSIETIRLAAADGQSHVKFRFMYAGTCSWFWGVDEFGLYEINAPVITSQPLSQTVSATSTAMFTVTATGQLPLSYQWRHANTNLVNGGRFSGVTNATLTISNVSTNDAGTYTVVVSNPSGRVTSAPAVLTVVVAPQITGQPVGLVLSVGNPASFSVSALGQPPLTYQWTRSGVAVGPSSSTLTIASVQASDAGQYQVNVVNTAGSALSGAARLIVAPPSVTNNLVVHLKFDGDYTDSSGRGNNATALGSPSFAPGKIGQAMKYTTTQDGSVIDYATLGYPADLKFVDSVDFSISFWANYLLQVDDPPFISNKNWDSSGNKGWGIFTQNSGHFRANVTGTGGTKYDINSAVTPSVRDGTWHNILMSYARGGPVSVYVDGSLIDTRSDLTTGTIDTDDLSYNVNVGQDGRGTYTDGGSAGITNALIDDVGIWRRALSPDEAAAIYTAGQAGKDLSQAVVSTVERPVISLAKQGNSWVITFTGTLYSSSTLNGTYMPVSGATNPYTVPTGSAAMQFYRSHQ